jgi:hypothetical protein
MVRNSHELRIVCFIEKRNGVSAAKKNKFRRFAYQANRVLHSICITFQESETASRQQKRINSFCAALDLYYFCRHKKKL